MQTIFFPVYSASLVILNTITASVFYKEYLILLASGNSFALFWAGVAVVAVGIGFFGLRASEQQEGAEFPHTSKMSRALCLLHAGDVMSCTEHVTTCARILARPPLCSLIRWPLTNLHTYALLFLDLRYMALLFFVAVVFHALLCSAPCCCASLCVFICFAFALLCVALC